LRKEKLAKEAEAKARKLEDKKRQEEELNRLRKAKKEAD